MAKSSSSLTPRQKQAQKAERARKLLSGAKLKGTAFVEDDVWEWIYKEDEESDEDGQPGGEIEEEDDNLPRTPSKRRKREVVKKAGRKIIGAKRGDFECHTGDTVLLQNDTGKDWVAIVYGFVDDEEDTDEKLATFLCMAT